MPKLIIMMKKKAGMSREDFIHYYETTHAPLGKHLYGHLWVKYVRNYPVPTEDGVTYDYDAITEIWFKDEASIGEMMRITSLPENVEILLNDENNFQDPGHSRVIMVEEIDTGTMPS